MPSCCLVWCGARKSTSIVFAQVSEKRRSKWLEAIGEENINPRQKEWSVCSLHFEENCINRTLDIPRLRDNAVPTIFSGSGEKLHQKSTIFCDTSNIKKSDVSCTSTLLPPLHVPHQIVENLLNKASGKKEHEESPIFCETRNITKSVSPTSTVMPPLQLPHQIVENVLKEVVRTGKMKALKEKYEKQQRKINCLNERIRKKNKKNANLKDIIEDLRKKNVSIWSRLL